MSQADWAEELGGAEFGDFRLSRRSVSLAERISKSPDASFPNALDESELEAAYRFFNNRKVTPQAILEPHIKATVGRIGDAVCLAVHDTTTFSFRPDGEREGLEKNAAGNQTFHAHVTLAVSGDRTPLGVLGLRTHVGRAATVEHERWGEQVTAVRALPFRCGQIVHVADREADDYEFLSLLQANSDRYVVRAQHDRRLAEDAGEPLRKLWDALPVKAIETRHVPLSPRSGTKKGTKQRQIHPVREGRLAKLALGASRVTLSCPERKNGPPSLTVNVVRVWELETPEGETPVEWLLFTSEPVDVAPQIAQVVDWYRARWVIEEYFKALKTGCAYEERQLESRHALENALALLLPIAWQLLLLRSLARDDPDRPAASVLPPSQLEVLQRVARRPLPPNPSVRDAVLAIAALGGHLKRNGEPGWLTIWRGYEELLTLTAGWELARRAPRPTTYDQS